MMPSREMKVEAMSLLMGMLPWFQCERGSAIATRHN
jgi:hypothetical protein